MPAWGMHSQCKGCRARGASICQHAPSTTVVPPFVASTGTVAQPEPTTTAHPAGMSSLQAHQRQEPTKPPERRTSSAPARGGTSDCQDTQALGSAMSANRPRRDPFERIKTQIGSVCTPPRKTLLSSKCRPSTRKTHRPIPVAQQLQYSCQQHQQFQHFDHKSRG